MTNKKQRNRNVANIIRLKPRKKPLVLDADFLGVLASRFLTVFFLLFSAGLDDFFLIVACAGFRETGLFFAGFFLFLSGMYLDLNELN